jgi:hypothetical protein
VVEDLELNDVRNDRVYDSFFAFHSIRLAVCIPKNLRLIPHIFEIHHARMLLSFQSAFGEMESLAGKNPSNASHDLDVEFPKLLV